MYVSSYSQFSLFRFECAVPREGGGRQGTCFPCPEVVVLGELICSIYYSQCFPLRFECSARCSEAVASIDPHAVSQPNTYVALFEYNVFRGGGRDGE